MTALLEVSGLAKHYAVGGGKLLRAVDGVDFRVEQGETLSIVGESGCGKSTLAKLVMRLVEPTAGAIRFDGRDLAHLSPRRLRPLRAEMQMIFQDPFASLNPRMTVGDILAEPLIVHGIGDARSRPARIRELMDLVGLSPRYVDRYPHEFSGGQRQRIGIARALAAGPRLVVGDEPVSALDVSVQAQILNLLEELKTRFGLTFVMISHDLAVVRHMSDRVGVMYLGKLVEIAPARKLFAQPRHPYAQALMAAAPTPDPHARESRRLLEGDVPSPLDPPPGCRFSTRCPFARDRCRVEEPALAETAPGHRVACHFWREIAAEAQTDAAPRAPSAAYEKRLALFLAGRARQSAQGDAAPAAPQEA